MKVFNFFIDCDPVAFDCWITTLDGTRVRKATVAEVDAWETLQKTQRKLEYDKTECDDRCLET